MEKFIFLMLQQVEHIFATVINTQNCQNKNRLVSELLREHTNDKCYGTQPFSTKVTQAYTDLVDTIDTHLQICLPLFF